MEERLALDQEVACSTHAAPATTERLIDGWYRRPLDDTWVYGPARRSCDICTPKAKDAYYALIVTCAAHFDPPFPERLHILRAVRRALPVLG